MRITVGWRVIAMLGCHAVLAGSQLMDGACPDRRIYSPTPAGGMLSSPSFPSSYAAGLSCNFNITTTSSNVVQLTFLSFDLHGPHAKSGQCLEAYVIVIVVDRQGREHVGERLCGQSLPAKIETMQPSVQVQFVTTAEGGLHRGFRIRYDIVSESAIREPTSYIATDAGQFAGQCGGRSQPGQFTGEISSPGYPTTFPHNCTCNWLIRVEPKQRIYIRIAHFHLSSTIAECERASLTIMDGYKHESSQERKDNVVDSSEARFCGSYLYYAEEGMKSYLSTANRIVVRMQTRDRPSIMAEGERIGFKIIWTAVEGLVDDTDLSLPPQTMDGPIESRCDQFVCQGGQICVEQGHGICVNRAQLCIHSSLVCDGVPNCVEGDFSDEQHCYSREILGATGGCFAALLCIVMMFVCCDQWRKRRRLRAMVAERRAAHNGKALQPPPPPRLGRGVPHQSNNKR